MSIIMPPAELESHRRDGSDHRLFSLSMRTMHSMEQLCVNAGCDRLEDELIEGAPVIRYKGKPALSALESGIRSVPPISFQFRRRHDDAHPYLAAGFKKLRDNPVLDRSKSRKTVKGYNTAF